mmetsp:Transcript_59723/g.135134  ORF Transcript_59723/g.135134 Transcript_59723/m.135134 type:complete len:267 (-) Transcript_59723:121-921(-)
MLELAMLVLAVVLAVVVVPLFPGSPSSDDCVQARRDSPDDSEALCCTGGGESSGGAEGSKARTGPALRDTSKIRGSLKRLSGRSQLDLGDDELELWCTADGADGAECWSRSGGAPATKTRTMPARGPRQMGQWAPVEDASLRAARQSEHPHWWPHGRMRKSAGRTRQTTHMSRRCPPPPPEWGCLSPRFCFLSEVRRPASAAALPELFRAWLQAVQNPLPWTRMESDSQPGVLQRFRWPAASPTALECGASLKRCCRASWSAPGWE